MGRASKLLDLDFPLIKNQFSTYPIFRNHLIVFLEDCPALNNAGWRASKNCCLIIRQQFETVV